MILVDTSIWIDHLNRQTEPALNQLLMNEDVLMHRFIYGEIALGSLKNRAQSLALLRDLHVIQMATDSEVAAMIEWEKLYSCGIGYVDIHLLVAARLANEVSKVSLWTRDKRLLAQAQRLGVAYAA